MVRQHHTTAAVAVTLALTATLAPAASADPAPLARAEAAIAATHASALVRPNPDNQTATVASTYSGPCSEICSGGASSYGARTQLAQTPGQSGATLPYGPRPRWVAAPGLYGTGSTAPMVVRAVAHSGGFHWADAGIGAGASLVLVGVGLAGMRAATNSRKRNTRHQRAIATN
jgi:uncharacterized protein with LGFP repeats